MLSATIRESNGVRSGNSTGSIRGLSSLEVSLGIVISNSILVSVWCRLFLLMICRGSMISRGRDVVGWGRMHHRGMISWGNMHNGGSMIGWGMVDYRGSMISRGMVNNWGRMVSRSWCMVCRSSMVYWGWSMVGWGSMVSWSSMVRRCRSISMCGESSWSVNSSRVFLIATIAMYRLWSSMGLAYNRGMYSAMGLVDRVAH